MSEMPEEVTNERIYEDLKAYQGAGMISYVLPTEPLGEQWIVGWNGQILKFLTKEGIVGFLAGIVVCADYKAATRRVLHSVPPFFESARKEIERRAGELETENRAGRES